MLLVGDELGAFGLALLGERPGADQRHLPAQEIGRDVERHLAALADEAGRAPRAHRAHGRGARLAAPTSSRASCARLRRASGRGSPPRCRSTWRRSRSSAPNSLAQLAALGRDVEGDDAGAHGDGELRRRQAHRALAEDGDGLAALQVEPLQRAPGRAGAAGDGRAGLERQRCRAAAPACAPAPSCNWAWPPWPPEP